MELNEERQRLAELYSTMSDGELEQLAEEADELSDDAHDALEAEIERRGLLVTLFEPTAVTPELRHLVTIRQFRDLPAALMAKGALEATGIECFLADDNMVRTDWFISNLLGGVKLNVAQADAPAALEVLDQPLTEDLSVEGVGEFHPPQCPACHSTEVAFEGINKKVFLATAVFPHVPIPLPRNSWKCYDCGATWQEENPAEAAADEGGDETSGEE